MVANRLFRTARGLNVGGVKIFYGFGPPTSQVDLPTGEEIDGAFFFDGLNGVTYLNIDGTWTVAGGGSAEFVRFENAIAQLPGSPEPSNVQEAIEALKAMLDDLDGGVSSVNGETGTVSLVAADIPFTPTGTISSTNVQAAIAEVASEGGGGGVSSVNGETGTVTLSAADIPFTPVGTIGSTNVQAAIAEVASEAGGGSGAIDTDQIWTVGPTGDYASLSLAFADYLDNAYTKGTTVTIVIQTDHTITNADQIVLRDVNATNLFITAEVGSPAMIPVDVSAWTVTAPELNPAKAFIALINSTLGGLKGAYAVTIGAGIVVGVAGYNSKIAIVDPTNDVIFSGFYAGIFASGVEIQGFKNTIVDSGSGVDIFAFSGNIRQADLSLSGGISTQNMADLTFDSVTIDVSANATTGLISLTQNSQAKIRNGDFTCGNTSIKEINVSQGSRLIGDDVKLTGTWKIHAGQSSKILIRRGSNFSIDQSIVDTNNAVFEVAGGEIEFYNSSSGSEALFNSIDNADPSARYLTELDTSSNDHFFGKIKFHGLCLVSTAEWDKISNVIIGQEFPNGAGVLGLMVDDTGIQSVTGRYEFAVTEAGSHTRKSHSSEIFFSATVTETHYEQFTFNLDEASFPIGAYIDIIFSGGLYVDQFDINNFSGTIVSLALSGGDKVRIHRTYAGYTTEFINILRDTETFTVDSTGGDTVRTKPNRNLTIIDGDAGTIASVTVEPPFTSANTLQQDSAMEWSVAFLEAVTTLTVSSTSAAILPSPTSASVNDVFTFIFNRNTNSWDRIK